MSDPRPLLWIVVGARPNFMKAAPVLDELRRRGAVETSLIHTGQHYDERMSELFFRDLGMPRPDVNLDARSGSHARQTAEVMVRLEEHLLAAPRRPDLVLVVGDVNSTLAAALVAAKEKVPVAHVEAGLRSFDRGMPEELNRICVDQLSELCFVTERAGMENLAREGKPADACVLVGNTMIDSLLRHRERAASPGRERAARLGLRERNYAVCTLHRPSNVDERDALERVLDALDALSSVVPVVWPVHPRTRGRARAFGLADRMEALGRVHLLEPLGYLEFLGLVDGAGLVLTDSGGLQEEACVLKVPCVTLRDSTERPSTIEMGGNRLCPNRPAAVVEACEAMMRVDRDAIGTPPLWDGRAASRIADELERRFLAARAAAGGAA